MRVEPEDAQLLAALAAVPRDRRDRSDREAVIAAEQDRQAIRAELALHRIHHGARPRDDFGQMAIAFARRLPGIDRTGEIAAIDDVEAARTQRLAEAGDAQRLGSHRRAAMSGADVGRRADQ